ncbi:MAG: pyridoxal-phosphate-dependent aminotransferase family protein [Paracoccaceae bacterium]
MTLSRGRDYLAIPGPSVVPDRVLQAMHRAAPNIYEGPLVELTRSVVANLKRVARTEGEVAIYIANGHGTWEAAISNIFAPGDTALVLSTGRFAAGWGEAARAHGVRIATLDFGMHEPADPARVQDALWADQEHRIKAVLVVQTDTASSVKNDVAALRAAIDAAGHPALFMVDCIASLACERFEMDAWGVDVMVAASQKGLMTPPGVGFTFHNGKAAAVRAGNPVRSLYWDWAPRVAPERFYQYFGGTAPTHHLFGLRAALDMLEEEGLEACWTRHETHARAVWTAVETWGGGGPLRLNIAEPAARSTAVTTITAKGHDMARLRHWCSENTGLTLGIGLGFEEPEWCGGDSVFRIGHMGHVNPPMILGALATVEAGMQALEIPHRRGGVGAAAEVVAAAAPAR